MAKTALLSHPCRQALEARLAALQHQSRMYGEGQDADADTDARTAPASAAAEIDPAINGDSEPAAKRRRRDSDDDDDG